MLFKYFFDIILSFFLLVLLSPFLLFIYILIYVSDRDNPIYLQERIGFKNKPFYIIKFRTMIVNAEFKGLKLKVSENDPRITYLGHFLRKYSVDELPQLFNILKGDMSFVGPRPLILSKFIELDNIILHRHNVLPGITGLAQSKGRRSINWRKRVIYDEFYAQNVNFCLDAVIIFNTLISIFDTKNIYRIKDAKK